MSVNPTHPLGRVQRYFSTVTQEETITRIHRLDRVWVLRVPYSLGDPKFDALVNDLGLLYWYEPVERFDFPQATLVLFERRPPVESS